MKENIITTISLIVFILLCFKSHQVYGQITEERKAYIDSIWIKSNNTYYGDKDEMLKVIRLSKKEGYHNGEINGNLNLAIHYFNSDISVDSTNYYLNIAAQLIQKYKDFQSEMAVVYNLKGAILTHKGFFNEALTYFNKAYRISIKGEDLRDAMAIKLDMLSVQIHLDNFDNALKTIDSLSTDSLFYDKKENDDLRHKLSSAKALAYSKQKDYEKSIEWWIKNVQHSKDLGSDKAISDAYRSIAQCYFDLKDYDNALIQAKKAYELTKVMDNRGIRHFLNQEMLGQIYYKRKEYQKSLTFLKKIKNSTDGPRISTPRVHSYIGNNYKSIKNWKQASTYYEMSASVYDSLYEVRNKEIALYNNSDSKLIEETHKNELLILSNKKQRLYIISLGIGLLSVFLLVLSIVFYKRFNKSQQVVETLKVNERKLLEAHIKQREQELLGTTISISKQMDQIALIKGNFSEALEQKDMEKLKNIEQEFTSYINSPSNLNMILDKIESQYPTMTFKLKEIHPELSSNDIKHCLLLKLDLSIKECAQILNVTTHAVKMGRKRVKQKVNITDARSLKEYIDHIV